MKNIKLKDFIIYKEDYKDKTILVPKIASKISVSDKDKTYDNKSDIIYENLFYFINHTIKKEILEEYLNIIQYKILKNI